MTGQNNNVRWIIGYVKLAIQNNALFYSMS